MNEDSKDVGTNVIILWGSQLGHGEYLAAMRLYPILSNHGFKVQIKSMDEHKDELTTGKFDLAIFFVSTFVNDFPDNALNFWSWLNKPDTKLAPGLKYSVFGLLNYELVKHFFAHKVLDQRLSTLSTRLNDVGEGDELDTDGYETGFALYVESLFHALNIPYNRHVPMYQVDILDDANFSKVQRADDDYIPVSKHVKLTPNNYLPEARMLELNLKGSKLEYTLGDYCSVRPQNSEVEVQQFLSFYELDPNQLIKITCIKGSPPMVFDKDTMLVKDVFIHYLDIFHTRPTIYLLQILSTFANEEDKAIIAKLTENEWQDVINERISIAEILSLCPSVKEKLTLGYLLAMMPHIRPRFYSVASTPLQDPLKPHICFKVHSMLTPRGKKVLGMCSNFMAGLSVGEKVKVGFKKGRFFKDHTRPLIGVCLGTGVSALVAELRHREALTRSGEQVGPVILYFGSRRKKKDFFFRSQLTTLKSDGILSDLVTAFSQDQDKFVFVQDKMEEDPELLWKYLKMEGVRYYYCGLGVSVATIIENAIKKVIQHCGKKNEIEAEKFVNKMKTENRWIVESHADPTQQHMIDTIEAVLKEGLVYGSDGSVSGGSLRNIFEHLTSSESSSNDVNTFLLTYRICAQPQELFTILHEQYRFWSTSTTNENESRIRKRNIILFLMQWVMQHGKQDFISDEFMKTEVTDFIHLLLESKNDALKRSSSASSASSSPRRTIKMEPQVAITPVGSLEMILELLQSHEKGDTKAIMSPKTNNNTSNNKSLISSLRGFFGKNGSMTLSTSLSNNKESSSLHIFSLKTTAIAQQLTLMTQENFQKIRLYELLDSAWQKKERELSKRLAPHVLECANRFNLVSNWVATEIVTAPKPALAWKRFIKVAQKLRLMNNFDDCVAIIAGLNNFCVRRLNTTYYAIPEKYREISEELDQLFGSTNNFKNYRGLLKSSKPPLIPFMALYLRDLTFIEDGNKTMLPNGMINFEKMRLTATVLFEIANCQTVTYSFGNSVNLDNLPLVHYLKSNPKILDTEELYKFSVLVQPTTHIPNSKLTGASTESYLHHSCFTNNLKITRIILEEGMNVNVRNSKFETPLHIVAVEGHLRIAELLLSSGADVNAQNYEGDTPLHFSASHNHVKLSKLLVEHGADLTIKNVIGLTPLDVAMKNVYHFLKVQALQPLMKKFQKDTTDNHLIEWNSLMEIGYGPIDDDHQQLLDAMNYLHISIVNNTGQDKIQEIFKFLETYTKFHFEREEKLFEEYHYPLRFKHEQQHKKLLKELKSFRSKQKEGATDVDLQLLNFLKDWLITHIMSNDKKFGEWFSKIEKHSNDSYNSFTS